MKLLLYAPVYLAIAIAKVAGECPFCLDGSLSPTPDKDIFTFEDDGTTCGDAELFAATLEADTFACIQIQDTGLSECGCTTPPELDMGCTLCADGSPAPNSDLEVIPKVTCAGIERFIRRFPASTCAAYHRTIGVQCGCAPPDPPVDVCYLCGGSSVDFPAAPLFVEELGTEIPCAFFEVIANDEDDNGGFPCAAFQIEGGTACCKGGDDTGLAPARDDINALCSEANVAGPGFFDCALACTPAQCCEDLSCSSGLSNCLSYLPCAILDTAPVPGESSEGTGPDPEDPAKGDGTTSSSSHIPSGTSAAIIAAGLALVAF